QGNSCIAYNQGVNVSHAEYILFINPDTITGKDTLAKVINFMDSHPNAGGASVRMVSPQGHFIRSSKYGFTRGWSRLVKWTGLDKYFIKSHITNKRQEEWAEEFDTAEVDVLNGAFMLLRRSALIKTGLLDERFFMYGYDIDISFRLKLEGFRNYYFPKTYIINFNVQQLSKFSWAYLKYFYGAMFIFVAKYLFEAPKLNLIGIPRLYTAKYEVER
ncbi:MAG: glycosyltransferase family 2 protein, partial [Sphingobacteriaceae bacterium]